MRASPPPRDRLRFHREATRDAYDAVVIGSGLGGLTAAAKLAHAGRSVLVVERHDRPGGYAHAFRRKRYHFDSAVHLIGGCEPTAFDGGGAIHRVLSELGVAERCAFVPVDPCYAAVYPGVRLEARSGLDEFTDAHVHAFPRQEKGLRDLVQACLNVRQETIRAEELTSPFDVMKQADRFPTLIRYHRATLADALKEHIADDRLAAIFATTWPFVGLPPSRVSFLYFSTMLLSYVADGAFYCRGTFQRLAEALVHALESRGGELLLRSTVRRICVENGRACGILLENGQRVDADAVVSNADARQTIEELVGPEAFPELYRTRLRRMEPSVSAFVVYAATELDLAAQAPAHETFLWSGFDHEAAWAGVAEGRPSWLTATLPTAADPELAPPGEQLLILTTLISSDAAHRWREAKPRYTEALLERAEQLFPGLRSRLTFAEGATPRTFERYTRNGAGAAYGWAATPAQVGPGRLADQTPIPGLHLAGHWTRPGGGVYGAVTSGAQTARRLLAATG